MEKIKNEQKLERLVDCVDKSGGTLFAVLGDDDNGVVHFTGDVVHLTASIHDLLKRAMSDDAKEQQIEMGNAIINAIYATMRDNSEEGTRFKEILGEIYEKVFDESMAFETEIKDFSVFDDSYIDDFMDYVGNIVSKRETKGRETYKRKPRKINIC